MQRIKTVFTDISAIAHLWANQQQNEARTTGNNFYFNEEVIYSYGSHFPIARITENKAKDKKQFDSPQICFFTNRSYSVTTSKHISVVSSASSHKDRLYMEYIPVKDYEINPEFHAKNISVWCNEIKAQLTKLITARKKEIYYTSIARIQAQILRYNAYFGIKPDKATKTLLTDVTANDTALNYLKKHNAAIAADLKAREKKEHALFLESLAKFRNFEVNRLHTNRTGFDYLRYNAKSNRFETSQDVEIPYAIGMKFYNNCILSTCTECTMFMDYTVKAVTAEYVHIGCHKVQLTEIRQAIELAAIAQRQ